MKKMLQEMIITHLKIMEMTTLQLIMGTTILQLITEITMNPHKNHMMIMSTLIQIMKSPIQTTMNQLRSLNTDMSMSQDLKDQRVQRDLEEKTERTEREDQLESQVKRVLMAQEDLMDLKAKKDLLEIRVKEETLG